MALFGPLPPESFLHAVRETLAHLVHLRAEGRVESEAGRPERWRAV